MTQNGTSKCSCANMKKGTSLVRPLVHNLHAYASGEQPKIKGLIKLNTNKNPYPPSPRVLRAVQCVQPV